jgi:Cu/Ag efflux protein CusF
MKRSQIFAILLVASTLPLVGVAANGQETHPAASHHHAASTESQFIEGTVKKIDRANGKVTLSHGALPNGMPPMTMAFVLKEKAWGGSLKEGDKILFRTETIKGVMTIVEIKPAGK